MKHIEAVNGELCQLPSPVDTIGSATRLIYAHVGCKECLRRAIAESEERARVLRELLAALENLS